LLATGKEFALMIALADDVSAAQAAAEAAFDEFIARLPQPPPGKKPTAPREPATSDL
jgi:hypothetical protein